MSLAFRRAIPSDMRLVVESFLDSYRTAHAAGLIAMEDWRDVMEPQWLKVLARPGVEVHVAHHPDEADPRYDVYGWLAIERGYDEVRKVQRDRKWVRRLVRADAPLVHYVYVKKLYRKHGIARGLFRAAGVDPRQPFNHTTTTAVVSELGDHVPLARFTPLIARHPKHDT